MLPLRRYGLQELRGGAMGEERRHNCDKRGRGVVASCDSSNSKLLMFVIAKESGTHYGA